MIHQIKLYDIPTSVSFDDTNSVRNLWNSCTAGISSCYFHHKNVEANIHVRTCPSSGLLKCFLQILDPANSNEQRRQFLVRLGKSVQDE